LTTAVLGFRAFVAAKGELQETTQYLKRAVQRAFPPKLRAQVLTNIAQNLAEKQALPLHDGKPFTLTH
jgi:hypothetical protein